MDIDDIYRLRAERVKALQEQFPGNKQAFADKVGIKAPIIAHWFMKGEHRKNIGEDSTIKIENAFELELWTLSKPGPIKAGESVHPWPFAPVVSYVEFDGLSDDDKKFVLETIEARLARKRDAVNLQRRKKKRKLRKAS